MEKEEVLTLYQKVQTSADKSLDGEKIVPAEEERAVDGLSRLKEMKVTTEFLVSSQVIS